MITKNASGVPAQNQSGDYAINLGQVQAQKLLEVVANVAQMQNK